VGYLRPRSRRPTTRAPWPHVICSPARRTPRRTRMSPFRTHVHGARSDQSLPHLADESRPVVGARGDDRFAVAVYKDGVLVGAVAMHRRI
jgi:hypothetical protein